MTIAAEVLRLAAIESLAPTGATTFPTLARDRVFDSRRPTVDALDPDKEYTPVLALFTRKSESPRRGGGQGSVARNGRTTLEVVAELAVASRDEDGVFVDAMVGSDPKARIVLASLCAQVRYVLTLGPSGLVFRKAFIAIEGIDEEGFAVPELGLRWQRNTMLFDCLIPDDEFTPGGGLPQPAAQIAAMLPEGSYASATIAAMAAQFPASEPLPLIDTFAFETKINGLSGQAGPADAVAPPFSDIGD
ncbi:hypothetical protein [Mesorhizobium sp. WSM3859]|uniref:hypothetical protein n=1 Tax=Mesorhizobium sp. WSM3859 TaxID=2029402 RepID=UPI000BAF83FC|nr:hypothetical protein [Mesorhizobium sp. WSM3859]PBC09192.1 hypothetical protein CK230_17055 [Mesorhizobium sp. WSM3859]